MMKRFFVLFLTLFVAGACSTQKGGGESPDGATQATGITQSGDQKEYTPRKTKGKVLVVYFSRSGRTESIAKTIALWLGADEEKIVDLNPRSYLVEGMAATFNTTADIQESVKNPGDYDYVILGTPIWSWSMTPAVRAYIKKHKGQFKHLAFFTTSGGTDSDGIVEDMEELAGQKSIGFTGFNDKDFENKTRMNEKLNQFAALFSAQ